MQCSETDDRKSYENSIPWTQHFQQYFPQPQLQPSFASHLPEPQAFEDPSLALGLRQSSGRAEGGPFAMMFFAAASGDADARAACAAQ